MKYAFYLLTVASLLAMIGCLSSRRPSARALLSVRPAVAQDLSPSSTASAIDSDSQMAAARVLGDVQNPRFRSAVASTLNISPETVDKVIVQRIADTRLLELRVKLEDSQFAAKLVNAMANQLVQDFAGDPSVRVRLVDTAHVAGKTAPDE